MRALPWLKISPLPLFLPVPLHARDHSYTMKLFVIAASIAAASADTQGQATAAIHPRSHGGIPIPPRAGAGLDIVDLSQVANVGTNANVGTEWRDDWMWEEKYVPPHPQ